MTNAILILIGVAGGLGVGIAAHLLALRPLILASEANRQTKLVESHTLAIEQLRVTHDRRIDEIRAASDQAISVLTAKFEGFRHELDERLRLAVTEQLSTAHDRYQRMNGPDGIIAQWAHLAPHVPRETSGLVAQLIADFDQSFSDQLVLARDAADPHVALRNAGLLHGLIQQFEATLGQMVNKTQSL